MSRHLLLRVLLVAGVTGCHVDRSRAHGNTARTSAAAAQAPAAQAVAAPADDDGCDADAKAEHPDPHLLVSEYLDRGGRGEFLASSTWHDGAVECPGHTPGFDGGVVVTGWRLSKVRETRDSVVFQVAFDRHSQIAQDSVGIYLAPASSGETDTITAVHKPYGWRVGGYEFAPHVLPAGVKAHLQLRGGDVRVIDSLIAGAGSRPGP